MEHEAGEEQEMRLFRTQKPVTSIVRILQGNETLKGRLNQAEVDCYSARSCRARNRLFQYIGYDCQLSLYSFNSEESVGQKEG